MVANNDPPPSYEEFLRENPRRFDILWGKVLTVPLDQWCETFFRRLAHLEKSLRDKDKRPRNVGFAWSKFLHDTALRLATWPVTEEQQQAAAALLKTREDSSGDVDRNPTSTVYGSAHSTSPHAQHVTVPAPVPSTLKPHIEPSPPPHGSAIPLPLMPEHTVTSTAASWSALRSRRGLDATTESSTFELDPGASTSYSNYAPESNASDNFLPVGTDNVPVVTEEAESIERSLATTTNLEPADRSTVLNPETVADRGLDLVVVKSGLAGVELGLKRGPEEEIDVAVPKRWRGTLVEVDARTLYEIGCQFGASEERASMATREKELVEQQLKLAQDQVIHAKAVIRAKDEVMIEQTNRMQAEFQLERTKKELKEKVGQRIGRSKIESACEKVGKLLSTSEALRTFMSSSLFDHHRQNIAAAAERRHGLRGTSVVACGHSIYKVLSSLIHSMDQQVDLEVEAFPLQEYYTLAVEFCREMGV